MTFNKFISVAFAAIVSAAVLAATSSCSKEEEKHDGTVYIGVNGTELFNAGAYTASEDSGLRIVEAYFGDAATSVSAEGFTGKGYGLWLDLNVSADAASYIAGGKYVCKSSDEAFCFFPGTVRNNELSGSFVWDGSKEEMVPVNNGTVSIAASNGMYLMTASLETSDRRKWDFYYYGPVSTKKESGSDDDDDDDNGGDIPTGTPDNYVVVDLTNGSLTQCEFDYYGQAYEEQDATTNNWTIYLAKSTFDMNEFDGNGLMMQIEVNTSSEYTKAIPAGKYTIADFNSKGFAPYTCIYGIDGGTSAYGTWSITDDGYYEYCATAGYVDIAVNADNSYTISYDFTDDTNYAEMKGKFTGIPSFYDASQSASSNMVVPANVRRLKTQGIGVGKAKVTVRRAPLHKALDK